MSVEFPKNRDGDALRRLIAEKNDLSQPMDVDFQITADSEITARKISSKAEKLGYTTSIYFNGEEEDDDGELIESWMCECTKNMLLTYDAIVDSREELDEIVPGEGSSIDGWSTMGNAPEEE